MEFGRKLVCDQLRTSFEPAGVMEFGFMMLSSLYAGVLVTGAFGVVVPRAWNTEL